MNHRENIFFRRDKIENGKCYRVSEAILVEPTQSEIAGKAELA